MHNKPSVPIDIDPRSHSMKKSKSPTTLAMISKKKPHHLSPIKIEVDTDHQLDSEKASSPLNKSNGTTSPSHHHHHRRRPKRSSINGNALLSTVASVHELMSFVIYKDHPPNWLKQTDLYQEYTNKSDQINIDQSSSDVLPHCHQQLYRKQRCNLHLYARADQSWQPLSSPRRSRSRTPTHRRGDSVESKHEVHSSPLRSAPISDLFSPLNVSVKQETREENALQTSSKSKSTKRTAPENTRRRQILCKKKLPDNAPTHRRLRRQRTNSVENQEPFEKKDSSSSGQSDSETSNTSTSSSIEHTSPSPTTTVSRSSSRRSSPLEYMRGGGSVSSRLSSPLRIRTSLSPRMQSLSTPRRRSTRIWAPSSFYINPMWILPTVISSKRVLADNSFSSLSPPTPSESVKRPRRRCRS